MLQRAGLTEADAARVLAAWLRAGLLIETEYRDQVHRKTRRGVRVVDAKRPTAASPQETPHAS